MGIKITEQYRTEKLDAYNVAIQSLRMHESGDDVPDLSSKLRNSLADKLESEINVWLGKHQAT